MDKMILPSHYNYISAFLTFGCNLSCPYCINKQGKLAHYALMPGSDWIRGLSKISCKNVPITISGGEPTIHPNFYEIVNGIDKPVDLLTNGQFDIGYFMSRIKPDKFKRGAKYASIRISYHPGITKLEKLLRSVKTLKDNGYEVGIWAVNHPEHIEEVRYAQRIATGKWLIDFRIKEYLGEWGSRIYGTYKYTKAVDGKPKRCRCKPSELLIAPNGNLYRCHRDLYSNENSYGNILDKTVQLLDKFMPCKNMGLCSYCDIKQKFDRFQIAGHCSVEIKERG